LTKSDIDHAVYQESEIGNAWNVRWDVTIPRFGVRIYPSEMKRYGYENQKGLLNINGGAGASGIIIR